MSIGQSSHDAGLSLLLPDPEATDALGEMLAPLLGAGDTLLLAGPIGAGKSQLARAIIRTLMGRAGLPAEDIPSPTYTLVQTYPGEDCEIWHADLYRISDPAEVFELGLDEAMASEICIVEWPDRLGGTRPPEALSVTLSERGDGRFAVLRGQSGVWQERLARLGETLGAAHDAG